MRQKKQQTRLNKSIKFDIYGRGKKTHIEINKCAEEAPKKFDMSRIWICVKVLF